MIARRRRFFGAVGTVAALLLAGCQNAAAPGESAPVPVAPPTAGSAQIEPQAPPDASFLSWIEQARADARKRGISAPTLSSAFANIAPIPRVIELDRRQPEFSNTFWRYLDSAVTEQRVAEGRALMQKHAALLASLERTYGVPGRFLIAFWGLETNFGRSTGDYPVVGALATLAYDGRRGAFFRDEMFNALTILDHGHITLAKMKGSWAGAMGQTQFMPSTFLKHAVDQDGDGRIDIWGSVPDALGSAANYLKSLGWDGTRTWGREVALPAKFDVALSSLDVDATETVKSLQQWSALGVTRTGGAPLPSQDINAALILPAGAKGPAFLVYDDYRIILKWNRSTFYALAIGHFADRLVGGDPLVATKKVDAPLKRDDVMALQQGLASLGLLSATPDGVMGSATRQAVRAFQKKFALPPDGYADAGLIEAVRARSGTAARTTHLASDAGFH